MTTFAQRLVKLNEEFTPERKHIVTMKEIYKVAELLELDGMKEFDLRNLRDMTVMFFDSNAHSAREDGDWDAYDKAWDKMSAVTSVIDLELKKHNYEV